VTERGEIQPKASNAKSQLRQWFKEVDSSLGWSSQKSVSKKPKKVPVSSAAKKATPGNSATKNGAAAVEVPT